MPARRAPRAGSVRPPAVIARRCRRPPPRRRGAPGRQGRLRPRHRAGGLHRAPHRRPMASGAYDPAPRVHPVGSHPARRRLQETYRCCQPARPFLPRSTRRRGEPAQAGDLIVRFRRAATVRAACPSTGAGYRLDVLLAPASSRAAGRTLGRASARAIRSDRGRVPGVVLEGPHDGNAQPVPRSDAITAMRRERRHRRRGRPSPPVATGCPSRRARTCTATRSSTSRPSSRGTPCPATNTSSRIAYAAARSSRVVTRRTSTAPGCVLTPSPRPAGRSARAAGRPGTARTGPAARPLPDA